MPPKKIIFFENIKWVHYPVLAISLLRKHTIYAFEYERSLKQGWVAPLVNEGRVIRLYFNPTGPEHGAAIDLTDKIFPAFSSSLPVRAIRSLFGDKRTDLIFKKTLVSSVYKTLYMNRTISRIRNENPGVPVSFVADGYSFAACFFSKGETEGAALEKVNASFLCRPLEALSEWAGRAVFGAAGLMYGFFHLAGAFLSSRLQGSTPRENFKFGIPVSLPVQVSRSGGRGVGMFSNGGVAEKNETIYISLIPLARSFIAPLEKEGYRFFDLSRLRRFRAWFSAPVEKGEMWTPFLTACLSPLLIFYPKDLAKGFFTALRALMISTRVTRQIRPRHYFYTNLESAEQTAMNLLLSRTGATMWNYASFLGGGYVYARNGDLRSVRHWLWSFQYFDHWLGMNPSVLEYIRLHRVSASAFHSIGSFYSDLVRSLDFKKERETLLRERFGITEGGDQWKVIGVFDTSFVDSPEAPTRYEDGLSFYEDFLRYLEAHPKACLVFKPSKDPGYFTNEHYRWSSPEKGRRIMAVWDKLKAHKRVFWAFNDDCRGDLDFSYNNQVLAAADVVVTHCLSSPTAEALGAGKKSFWYESGNLHKGTLFAGVPGLVCHGYEELEKRIDELTRSGGDQDWSGYLKKNIYGTVTEEGSAFARLKSVLKETDGQ